MRLAGSAVGKLLGRRGWTGHAVSGDGQVSCVRGAASPLRAWRAARCVRGARACCVRGARARRVRDARARCVRGARARCVRGARRDNGISKDIQGYLFGAKSQKLAIFADIFLFFCNQAPARVCQ